MGEEDSQAHQYKRALEGVHPDLNKVSRGRVDAIDRVDVAVNLLLRDVFTPLCFDFSKKAEATPADEVHDVAASFDFPPDKQPYFFDQDKFDEQRVALQNSGETSESLRAKSESLRTQAYKRGNDLNKLEPDYHERIKLPEYSEIAGLEYRAAELERQADTMPQLKLTFPDINGITTHYLEVMRLIDHNANPGKVEKLYGDVLSFGDFAEHEWSPAETNLVPASFVKYVLLPVTEYGEEFTERLIITTKVMLALAERYFGDTTSELFKNHRDLLLAETARGALDTNSSNPPLATFQEGIITIAGAISHLMAERIEGYNDADSALGAILSESLPSHLSMHAPMGLIMPAILSGHYIKDLVDVSSGKSQINHNLIRILATKRAQITEQQRLAEQKRTGSPKPVRAPSISGLGCPVGKSGHEFHETGIGTLGKAFLSIYKALYS